MAVTWQWEDRMGYIKWNAYGEETTVDVYRGNCLCVMIHNIGEEKYSFAGFFNDIEHLKKCIGLQKNYSGKKENLYESEWLKWTLDINYEESLKIAKLLNKAGFEVEVKSKI